MGVIDTFGKIIEDTTVNHPRRAGKLLKLGWQAQNLKFKVAPDKRLLPSGAYLSTLLMDAMLAPLKKPEKTSLVSVFTPCELLHLYGLHPYNVEGFSCYIAATHAETSFLHAAEDFGIPETFCSYHKVFIGAAYKNLLPAPKLIVSTNLACDANQITFGTLADYYNVPHFVIDVPIEQSEYSVKYVASQFKQLHEFMSKATGQSHSEDELKAVLVRSKKTVKAFTDYMVTRADKLLLQDLVTPLYEFVAMNILLGTKGAEKYAALAAKDAAEAPVREGIRLFWNHTVPYLQNDMKQLLNFTKTTQIVGIDMATSALVDFDPMKPYEAMARRMVYNTFNGTSDHRINTNIEWAKKTKADGAVWYCHCGCKHTLGSSALAKKKFEEAGIPLLVLNGDGCDRSSGNEGQNRTRMEAFLEMLGKQK